MTSRYAEGTTVDVSSSRAEIERLLARYGADQFLSGWDSERAVIAFTAYGRQVRFVLPMPTDDDIPKRDGRGTTLKPEARQKKHAQEERRRWRALALAIKAKLEVVETGIATFEDEFLAHIVLPDGSTVGDHVGPALAAAYETGRLTAPLLAIEGGQ